MKPGQGTGFCHSARCPAGALLCGPNGRGSLQKGMAGLCKGTVGPKGLTLSLSAYKSNTRQIKNTHVFLQMYFSLCTVITQLK